MIWTVLTGEALALILALAPPPTHESRLVYFGLISLIIQWVTFTTLGGLYLFRDQLSRLKPLYVAQLALILLVVSAWTVAIIAVALTRELWPADGAALRASLLRYTGITLIVGLLALAGFKSHLQAEQLAIRAKQAELEALQSRIHPHFLFNTLNTGAALVHSRPADAEQLLLDLADLFRASLRGPGKVPLKTELDLCRRYVEIERLRFAERLNVRWQLPDSIPEVLAPTLCLQPLLENAIRHGVEAASNPAPIDVALTETRESVQITVRNAMPDSTIPVRQGHNVGIASTRARIRSATGGQGHLTAGQSGDCYVAVITLPKSR